MENKITDDYTRGLIDEEGYFTFHPVKDYYNKIKKIPAFSLRMSQRDATLIIRVRDHIKLRNKVYEYKPRYRKYGFRRQGMSHLLVRDLGQLKNIIVPFFYKKLVGYKSTQFENWLKNIG